MFEIKKTDFERLKKDFRKKYGIILIEATTDRQDGNIAGSKLLKFYNHLNEEINRFFEIKQKEFEYDNKKSAKYFFGVKSRREIISSGPLILQKENAIKFKKAHRNTFIKSGRLFAKEKINFTLRQFIENWKKKNAKKMKEMGVINLKVFD